MATPYDQPPLKPRLSAEALVKVETGEGYHRLRPQAQGIGTRASAASTWMVEEANGWGMNPSFTSSVSVSPG